jgi:hypothetical protein
MFPLADYEIMWEKYGTARRATREDTMQRRKDAFACRITKAAEHTAII